MKLLPKWRLTDKYPAFYDTESATAIEQTAKVYAAMQEMIEDYNKFVDGINDAWEEYKTTGTEEYEVFQRKMEQLYSDFVKVIEMKYQSQDMMIQQAVSEIIASLPGQLQKTIDEMYKNGEFDTLVYNSIANLKADFDKIVANNNTFQSNINKSFANLVQDVESYKGVVNTQFESLENELTQKFEDLKTEAGAADMLKSVYDTNNTGVVDNSEMLGGRSPEYYAKQQDLDQINVHLETINNSVTGVSNQVATVQQTANTAKATSDEAKATAESAANAVANKLGKGETAANSAALGGRPATYYAAADDAISEYSHSKTGNTHFLIGSGDNIKFIAAADFVEGDIIQVNGVEVTALSSDGEPVAGGSFKSGNVVSCFLNGTVLNFKAGGGLSNSKLALATATEADVLSGFTFFSGNGELKTGNASIKFHSEKVSAGEKTVATTSTIRLSKGKYLIRYTIGGRLYAGRDIEIPLLYLNGVNTVFTPITYIAHHWGTGSVKEMYRDEEFTLEITEDTDMYMCATRDEWDINICLVIYKA